METGNVLDTEHSNVPGNRIKGEEMAEATTMGRKILTDISNLQKNQDLRPQSVSLNAKEYIHKLHQENMSLVKLLADRNKIIQLHAMELQKLRVECQQVQQKNLQLAQTNSQMLAELNSSKDRLKVLQHELGCKNGLLKATKLESEDQGKIVKCQIYGSEVETIKTDDVGKLSLADNGDNKLGDKRRKQKSKSLDHTTVEHVQAKEKTDKKRLCSRRQSARFKCQEQEPEQAKDSFQKDDAKFSVSPLHECGSTSLSVSLVKDESEAADSTPGSNAQELRRTSIRPKRQAVDKVQSYKEIPINVKMRRTK